MDKPVVMIGVSAAVRGIEEEIVYASRSDAKVLITGESGSGKEIVARLIHQRSARSRGPLVTINCAGFPDTLLETELFGHVKGSFTDAYRDKRGWLEVANGGTMFMDEVGEMSMRMQALLLRFLETGEVQRVGSERRQAPLDVRVITATHRRLTEKIADKSFREDLFYRLNVVHIEVPALRQRREDVPLLLGHFLRQFSETHGVNTPEVAPEALQQLVAYDWPGNVRELKNAAERLVLRARSGRIGVEELPSDLARRLAGATSAPASAASTAHHALFERMTKEGDTFWSAVYEPFMARDLTREDVRAVIRSGLEHTRGNYKLLVSTFNMPAADYKRFLNFLRKYECHVPFQRFRMVPAQLEAHHARPRHAVGA